MIVTIFLDFLSHFLYLSVCVEVFENCCVQQTIFSSGWAGLVRFDVVLRLSLVDVLSLCFFFWYLLCSLVCSSVLPQIFLHPASHTFSIILPFSKRKLFTSANVWMNCNSIVTRWGKNKKRIEIEFFFSIHCLYLTSLSFYSLRDLPSKSRKALIL